MKFMNTLNVADKPAFDPFTDAVLTALACSSQKRGSIRDKWNSG